MTEFFIPGISGDERSTEAAYHKLRTGIEGDLGHLPCAQRIFRLWTRRGADDCVAEVGRGDALCGGTVIAIFTMGPREPFVVFRQQRPGSRDGSREILDASPSFVLEFGARAPNAAL